MKTRLIERGLKPEDTRDIPINDGEFLIGRGADCNHRMRDGSISRHHCLIRLGNTGATVMDLGSSNGTYLNEKRVLSQADLHSGDELRLGNCRFVVDLGDADLAELGGSGDTATSMPTIRLPNSPKVDAPPK